MNIISVALTRDSAKEREEEEIQRYQRQHGGNLGDIILLRLTDPFCCLSINPLSEFKEERASSQKEKAENAMIDYFLSGFDGCCLNCPEQERRIICGSGNWCDRCLCLKGCEYYGRGYCGIRKQLLNELRSQYLENPDGFLRWLRGLKSEGIRIPKVVREMTEVDLQTKLF